MSLFVRKDLASLLAEAGAGTLRRELGPLALVTLGIGAVIGAGIFVLTGKVASRNAGPALDALDGVRRGRLRIRGAVLRRAGQHDPGGGKRLHLRLRHHGRARRLDHRLGPGARVLAQLLHRRRRLVGLRGDAARRNGHTFPPRLTGAPGSQILLPDGSTRHRACSISRR